MPLLLTMALMLAPAPGDNTLTDAEAAEGWRLLFDGRTLDGWMTSGQTPSKRGVDDGALNPHGCGGYMLIHETDVVRLRPIARFSDHPRLQHGGVRADLSLEAERGQGRRIQRDRGRHRRHEGGRLPRHRCALYDLVKPSRNAMKPAGEWNHLEVTCDGPRIVVAINGEVVTRMDLDQWTEPNRRPDGSEHKFDVAYKDHPRSGYIGLQDHGSDCRYKNIKLRPIRHDP